MARIFEGAAKAAGAFKHTIEGVFGSRTPKRGESLPQSKTKASSETPTLQSVAERINTAETIMPKSPRAGESLPISSMRDIKKGLTESEIKNSIFVADVSAECVGKVGEHQKWITEDKLVQLQGGRVVAVFDGFDPLSRNDENGHEIFRNNGYKASEVASKSFEEFYRDAEISASKEEAEKKMLEAMLEANEKVGEKNSESPDNKGIGTTFVGSEIWRDSESGESMLTVGNSGDSMAYLYRDGKLERISKEHSFVNFLNNKFDLGIDDQNNDTLQLTLNDYIKSRGVEVSDFLSKIISAKNKIDLDTGKIVTYGDSRIGILRNRLIGGLNGNDLAPKGETNDLELSIATIKLQKGDKILMCSDGLSDSTDEAKIAEIVREYESKGPEAIKQALVEQGIAAQTDENNLRANKKDDTTVAWIEFKGFEEPETELSEADLEMTGT